MATDTSRLIQALVGATSKEKVPKANEVPQGPLVTISRMYGAGGRSVAEKLSQRLGVKTFDREILEAIVEEAKVHRYLMEDLDEHVRGTVTQWVTSLISGQDAFAEDYRRSLVKFLLAIAKKGGVIVGRGAHLVLARHESVFRVRIVGTPERCAERIATREYISVEEARNRVEKVNRERLQFVETLYNCQGEEAIYFDLVVNSDAYTPEQMAEVILAGMQEKGIKLPEKHGTAGFA